MRAQDLESVLEKLAPSTLAEPGDNVGLLVGSRDAAIERLLVALEVTTAVVAEAQRRDCQAILTHHPLLYTPLRSLVWSRPREQLVMQLVSGGTVLFSYHTNLDAAPGGLADVAAAGLGLKD
ncbi:MAG: Nif3-like dinuclear metal center hexameric protein [Thermoleophilia bacterium]|nr:Nif3-like dinuclear metal center hexameric protein [Thermoleophilia bacterium]